MNDDYWHWIDKVKPQNSERVLFSDGNSIVIGSLTILDDTIHWLFDRADLDGYKPLYWKDLPKPPPISKNENILE